MDLTKALQVLKIIVTVALGFYDFCKPKGKVRNESEKKTTNRGL